MHTHAIVLKVTLLNSEVEMQNMINDNESDRLIALRS